MDKDKKILLYRINEQDKNIMFVVTENKKRHEETLIKIIRQSFV